MAVAIGGPQNGRAFEILVAGKPRIRQPSAEEPNNGEPVVPRQKGKNSHDQF
jgi:hypothetical protein